jgi:hypothetical protein
LRVGRFLTAALLAARGRVIKRRRFLLLFRAVRERGLLAMAIVLKNVFNTPIQRRARQLRGCANRVLSAALAAKLD